MIQVMCEDYMRDEEGSELNYIHGVVAAMEERRKKKKNKKGRSRRRVEMKNYERRQQ